MSRGFFLCSAPSTQRLSINPSMLRCCHVIFKEPTLDAVPNLLHQDPWGGSSLTNWWAGPSTLSSLAVAFPITPLWPGTQMRLTEIWLVLQYEIFSRQLHILFFATVPSYIIPDCVWHCSCVFKHPVHAVAACHLEIPQNSIELKEQNTRSTCIWKTPIIKLIFVKHVLINEMNYYHRLFYGNCAATMCLELCIKTTL
jgi:hypothetical protein